MKSLIVLGLLALPAIAHAEVNTQCWDGSFGYNYAKIVETSRGVEVSLTGSTLGLPSLYDNWNHSFNLGSWASGSKPSLHIVLPNKAVVTDGVSVWNDKMVTVEENGWQIGKYPKIWVRHGARNLGQWQWLYSDIEVSQVIVKASDDEISISFRQHYAPGEPALQTVTVGCSSKTAPAELGLPSEIANVIDAAPAAQTK